MRSILAICVGLAVLPAGGAVAQSSKDQNKLVIDHIDLKPIKDGLYDATVGFVLTNPNLGKSKMVEFSIVIGGVHDADEAITKVHEPIDSMSGDLKQGFYDLHRGP